MPEVVKTANTLFMSIISDKDAIALLGRPGTGSLLFYKEDTKRAVAGIPPKPSSWCIQFFSS